MIRFRLPAAATARGGMALAVGAVLALGATGCAGQINGAGPADTGALASAEPAPDPRSSTAPQIHPRWRSCAGEPSLQPPEGQNDVVPLLRDVDSFRPVAAVMCGTEMQRRPDGGLNAIGVEDRADDVAVLVATLRLPDAPEPAEDGDSPARICTLEGHPRPPLVLLDSQGRWVRPEIPRDDCGKPRAEFTAALARQQWTRISTRVLREIESAEAAASGCDQRFTDMVWFTGVYPPSRPADLAPLATDAASVRLCVYRVQPSERGSEKPQGEFVSGGLLPPGRWAAVKREVQVSAEAATCATPASRFARLQTPQGDIHVELDGCRRLVAPGVLPDGDISTETIRQGSTALPALLTRS
jgi:hypothetical protein